MKKNRHHGLCKRKIHSMVIPCIHFEIWSLFTALSSSSLFPPSAVINLENYGKGNTRLEIHFQKTLHEFIFLLDLFQYNLDLYEKYLNTEESLPNESFLAQQTAGVAAKSILVTLNILADDIARLIFIIYNKKPSEGEDVSFHKLMKAILKDKNATDTKFKNLVNIFKKLDEEGSWFQIGFIREKGLQQRLVHHSDLLTFTGVQEDTKGSLIIVRCNVASLFVKQPERVSYNFTEELKKILASFCDWLDNLYDVLYQELKTRNNSWPEKDKSYKYGSSVMVPTFYDKTHRIKREAIRTIPDEDYLYFPKANDF